MKPITRREFTQTLAAAGTGAALSPFRVLGANDRVRLGFIGLGNRGDQVLDAFLKHPDAEVVAICDLYAALPGLRREEDRHQPQAVQGLPASCSN